MKFNMIFNAFCCATILAVPGQAWCQTELPSQVGLAIARHYPNGVIENVAKKQDKGRVIYTVAIESDEKDRVVELNENGEILTDNEDSALPVIGGALSLGFGITSETAIYKDADDELRFDPALIYHNNRFHLQAYDGINSRYDFYQSKTLSVSVFGELFTDGFEASDSSYLLGMDEPGMVFAAGLATRYISSIGAFELKLLNDATGKHDGQQGELTYTCLFKFMGTKIIPSVTLAYMSAEVADYYYGVSTAESKVDRPAYSPDSALNFSVKVMGLYPLTANLSLVGIVDNSWLDATIEDSPIVDSANEMSVTVGLLYEF